MYATKSWLAVLTATVLVPVVAARAQPMGTAFTYQGELSLVDDGPVDGWCDFQFTLWDADGVPEEGNQVGPTINDQVDVNNGRFTVLLDFEEDGFSGFNGEGRWLKIAVCCPSPCAPEGLEALDGRQKLTPTPHALALPGLWTQQNETSPNLIGGYSGNCIGNGAVGATVGGGGNALNYVRAYDDYCTVGGGEGNQAGWVDPENPEDTTDAMWATIAGGVANRATGRFSTVGGGMGNTAAGEGATVGGGGFFLGNTADGHYATVGGGDDNEATGRASTIGGGGGNEAQGEYTTISGGRFNSAQGVFTTIAGGGPSDPEDPDSSNRVYDDYGTVGGGADNDAGHDDGDTTTATCATIGGGCNNAATGAGSTVGGGVANWAITNLTTVGGGNYNMASGELSTIGGGFTNDAMGSRATIAGGSQNSADGWYNTIGGGELNTTNSIHATVGGGADNHADGQGAVVAGGYGNTAGADRATVGGGSDNTVNGRYATVPGGRSNHAAGDYSFAGGHQAQADHDGSFVWADDTGGAFASTGEDQFLIRASGGVGIGTANPAADLHVAGTTRFGGVGTIVTGERIQAQATGGARILGEQGNLPARPAIGFFSINGEDDGAGGNGIYRPAPNAMAFATCSQERMRITAGGSVGIGRAPAVNALEVEGKASKTTAGDWLANSDAKIKVDVTVIDHALETLGRLRPIKFKYTDEYRAKHDSIEDIHYFNYIAQEFQEVFPDFVKDSGEDGLLQIDTYPASVYAVAAVQELHALAKQKDTEVAALKARLAALEDTVASIAREAGETGGAR